ncbi:Uncharacterised protein [Chlamydia abortus]|nr:Uncharacterised protein [Chlamydia abortus]
MQVFGTILAKISKSHAKVQLNLAILRIFRFSTFDGD